LSSLPPDYRVAIENSVREQKKYPDYIFTFYSPQEAVLRRAVSAIPSGTRVAVVRVDWTPQMLDGDVALMVVREFMVFSDGHLVSSVGESDLKWVAGAPKREKLPNQLPEPTSGLAPGRGSS
jgi:hypothetical protein